MSLHSFLWHAVLSAYPVLLLVSGRIHPTIHHFWYPFAFLLVFVPPVWLFDVLTGYNYLFVLFPPAGTPLAWIYSYMGGAWRLGYALLTHSAFRRLMPALRTGDKRPHSAFRRLMPALRTGDKRPHSAFRRLSPALQTGDKRPHSAFRRLMPALRTGDKSRRLIRPFLRSTSSTCTSTISPT